MKKDRNSLCFIWFLRWCVFECLIRLSMGEGQAGFGGLSGPVLTEIYFRERNLRITGDASELRRLFSVGAHLSSLLKTDAIRPQVYTYTTMAIKRKRVAQTESVSRTVNSYGRALDPISSYHQLRTAPGFPLCHSFPSVRIVLFFFSTSPYKTRFTSLYPFAFWPNW